MCVRACVCVCVGASPDPHGSPPRFRHSGGRGHPYAALENGVADLGHDRCVVSVLAFVAGRLWYVGVVLLSFDFQPRRAVCAQIALSIRSPRLNNGYRSLRHLGGGEGSVLGVHWR